MQWRTVLTSIDVCERMLVRATVNRARMTVLRTIGRNSGQVQPIAGL